MMGTKLGTKMK